MLTYPLSYIALMLDLHVSSIVAHSFVTGCEFIIHVVELI
jgi:hypothetical protein